MKRSIQQILQAVDLSAITSNPYSLKHLYALKQCRTSQMGYHLFACSDQSCTYRKQVYHSCRNRHCPNCGTSKQQQWVEARMRELIPCKYFHLVFTLPHDLNTWILHQRNVFFDLLFEVSQYTLQKLGKDPKYLGATPGCISVLHTWGQTLSFHPHVHCIVAGGGVAANGKWIEAKKAKYGVLFPIQALTAIYKARFLFRIKQAYEQGIINPPDGEKLPVLMRQLKAKHWNVYAKQPFGGPAQVVAYLGNYTHKVAISNKRIRKIRSGGTVVFTYNDYKTGSRNQRMELSTVEFVRRFEQHILPERFCKIRSYGFYSNHGRRERIADILKQLNVPEHPPKVSIPWQIRLIELTGKNTLQCPVCKSAQLELIETIRGSPPIHPQPTE